MSDFESSRRNTRMVSFGQLVSGCAPRIGSGSRYAAVSPLVGRSQEKNVVLHAWTSLLLAPSGRSCLAHSRSDGSDGSHSQCEVRQRCGHWLREIFSADGSRFSCISYACRSPWIRVIADLESVMIVLMQLGVLADMETGPKQRNQAAVESLHLCRTCSPAWCVLPLHHQHSTSSSLRPREAQHSKSSTHVVQMPCAMAARSNSAFQ